MEFEPFSKLLRRLRRAAHLTQEELAEKAGYSPDYVSMLERGLRAPPPLTVDILAKALRLDAASRTAMLAAAGGVIPTNASSAAPSDLVGREDDEAKALELLGVARLVTLTGPGGVGKTSLAARVAARASSSFTDGSISVDLTPVTGDSVVSAIGAALGRVGDDMADVLARLRGREMLLVLDGFERFHSAAAEVAEFLAASPKLKVLVTSRIALRLSAEREMPVAPLALPVKGSDGTAALSAPAVALFIQRARVTDPRFECTPGQAHAVAAICARVDGLPLAIELAAARLKHMPLAALSEHLTLGLLTGGARDLPVRHQRMTDTIAWSYDLLSPIEKTRIQQLAVFVGGFTLDAAEAVCGDDDVLSVVASLVDKSLLVVDRECSEPRYRMLDTIREFAAQILAASPDLEATRRRHTAYFTRFAEASEPGLMGRAQRAWYRRIESDEGNLRWAVEHLLETGDIERAMRLTGCVWLFWQSRGDYQSGKWLERALDGDATVPAPVRAKVYWGAGWLAFRRGEFVRATALGDSLRVHANDTNDAVAARNALAIAGHVAMAEGRSDEAIEHFRHGVSLCRPLGTSWHLAMSLLNLGVALLHARRLDEARCQLTEAMEMHRAIGDEIFAARAIAYLGYVALFSNDIDRAEGLFVESSRAFEAYADEGGIAEGLAGLAAVRAAQGHDAEAATLASESENIRARSGWRPLPSDRAAWTRYLERTR